LEYFENDLQTQLQYDSSNTNSLSTAYNNIALARG
ncbi:unnamed protein product, partial [Rotaria sp. Silwood1]